LRIQAKNFRIAQCGAVGSQDGADGSEDSCFPIDQGAVAVESDDAKTDEIQAGFIEAVLKTKYPRTEVLGY